jgi:hypothetical protein
MHGVRDWGWFLELSRKNFVVNVHVHFGTDLHLHRRQVEAESARQGGAGNPKPLTKGTGGICNHKGDLHGALREKQGGCSLGCMLPGTAGRIG